MKNLIRLIYLSLILLTTYATAQITIDDATLSTSKPTTTKSNSTTA